MQRNRDPRSDELRRLRAVSVTGGVEGPQGLKSKKPMRDARDIFAASFPRPGRALKAVLIVLAAFAILGGIVVNWAPGGPTGVALLEWLVFQPSLVFPRVWTLFTSGLVTDPAGISHALWALVGLYFLGPDLEARWGGARFVRFLIAAVFTGNLAVLLMSVIPYAPEGVHPSLAFGPMAAVEACAVAWGKENADRRMRFMFFLEMSGRAFMWITIGFAVVALVFLRSMPEGAVAPLGGVLAGVLLSGSPSPVRSLWLRVKLAVLRKRGASLSVESLTGSKTRAVRKPSRSGPSLRVLRGGDGDEPPKDKRHLN